MKKKIMLIIFIGLLVISIVSAALVTYLSNRAEATLTVSSPIVSDISKDKSTWGSSVSMSAFGGETNTIYLRTENRANVTINGKTQNKISSTGISCKEFSSITVTIDSNVASIGETELLPGNCINGTNEVELKFGADSWSAYRKDNATVKITFAPSTVGTYVFGEQVLIP